MSDLDGYYSDSYEDICYSGAIGMAANVLHRSIEWGQICSHGTRLADRVDLRRVLEIGAGQGQHRQYVRHDYDEYVQSDLRPELIPSPASDPRVVVEQRSVDAQDLPYLDAEFDRVVVTCVLAHLVDPEAAIEEWLRVLRPGGSLSIFVPCEPGIVLRVSQTLTTRRKQARHGFDGWLNHYRDHRNHFPAMAKFLRYHTADQVTSRYFPLPGLGWNANLWSVFSITHLEKASGAHS